MNFNPSNKKIGLLGAGGSSRALLAGLSENGASEILICNRTKEKATKLVQKAAEKGIDILKLQQKWSILAPSLIALVAEYDPREK